MAKNPPRVLPLEHMGYPALLGVDSWSRLHSDIQKRFSTHADKSVTYKGVMSLVYSSFAGKCFAQFCRLIGTPLALYSGKNVPLEVKVYPDKKRGGLVWDRFYHFSNKVINRVKSTKCIQRDDGLVEMVGCGFGMKLRVYEKDGAIYFASTRFFWQLGKYKILIPDILSPGKTIVSQKALTRQKFQFSLVVKHRLFGKVFEQVGIFEEIK
ncbi:DUF4166 domain-containing protein [Aliikangiella sp. IMCC44359]|uniref:DUF4166 domain-containing protein n=1 Tax=Aliikangiella sp. IMCC44359 TaxID=3459125 RepID=UPI00403A7CF1